jgi:hypothetical protein
VDRKTKGTRDKLAIIRPQDESFIIWADADFSGNWHAETAMDDPHGTLEVRIHHLLLGDPDRVEVTVAD